MTGGWVWGSEWSDSTGANHGGLITLSWWMYVNSARNISPTWYIDMLGGNGNVVAAIANQEAGSNITEIDVKTTSGWTEVPSIVNLNNWQQVTMQINFAGSTNTYRPAQTGAAAASASVVPKPGAIISLAAALAGLLACASRPVGLASTATA